MTVQLWLKRKMFLYKIYNVCTQARLMHWVSDICMSSHTSLLECFKHFLAFDHGVNEVNLEDTIFDGNKKINVANESRMAHKI